MRPSSSASEALRGYEFGGGISAFFLTDLEGAEAAQPPSAWITLPAGRFRVQIDYLRSVRSEPLYYAGYGHTDDQGREISYDVAREDHHVVQVLGVALKWPIPRLGRSSYLLIGGAWQRGTTRGCVAVSPGDRPEHGARLDFPPRSLRRRRFAARNGSSAHDLSHVSGQRRRSAARGRFSVVGGQRAKFGPRGPQGPPETATRVVHAG